MGKLISVRSMTMKTGYKCHDVVPSAINPRKKLVTDYKSRSIIFKDRENIKRVAIAMLSLADSEEMKSGKKALYLTAMVESRSEKGYDMSVVLSGPE